MTVPITVSVCNLRPPFCAKLSKLLSKMGPFGGHFSARPTRTPATCCPPPAGTSDATYFGDTLCTGRPLFIVVRHASRPSVTRHYEHSARNPFGQLGRLARTAQLESAPLNLAANSSNLVASYRLGWTRRRAPLRGRTQRAPSWPNGASCVPAEHVCGAKQTLAELHSRGAERALLSARSLRSVQSRRLGLAVCGSASLQQC